MRSDEILFAITTDYRWRSLSRRDRIIYCPHCRQKGKLREPFVVHREIAWLQVLDQCLLTPEQLKKVKTRRNSPNGHKPQDQ